MQFIITEVGPISRGQLQNNQLHSPGRASRCRRAYGICALPSQFPFDAGNMAKEGYQSMLENLIRFLKDGRMCLVKQGELFILSLLQGVPKSIGI